MMHVIALIITSFSNFGAVGDGSYKGNVGKVGKISNFGAIGDGSDKNNVGKVGKISNVGKIGKTVKLEKLVKLVILVL